MPIKNTDPKVVSMLAQRGALHLETLGMTRHGTSCYQIVKRQFGFRGNKISVLRQLEDHIEEVTGIPLKNRYTPRTVVTQST